MFDKMLTGNSASAKTIVSELNIAKTVKSGDLDVFSTPMMIALMEQAACNCMSLNEGESSVGTYISAEHLAASGLGAEITATATITEIEGRKVTFDVTAKDNDKEIGKGTHVRFVIDAERFMSKVK